MVEGVSDETWFKGIHMISTSGNKFVKHNITYGVSAYLKSCSKIRAIGRYTLKLNFSSNNKITKNKY